MVRRKSEQHAPFSLLRGGNGGSAFSAEYCIERKHSMIKNFKASSGSLNPGMLIDELWETAVEAASPAEFGPNCGRFLRAWNNLAVERMEAEGRLTPEDLATAESNLRRFIQLMKTESVFLGHANRLDQACFRAAHRRLERRSLLTQFTLWPFWPNSVAEKGVKRR